MQIQGRALKRIWFWNLVLWIGPGTVVNWFFRNELWWTNFMSLLALQVTFATLWAAARTEAKQDEAMNNGSE
jgi:hypothetical protein